MFQVLLYCAIDLLALYAAIRIAAETGALQQMRRAIDWILGRHLPAPSADSQNRTPDILQCLMLVLAQAIAFGVALHGEDRFDPFAWKSLPFWLGASVVLLCFMVILRSTTVKDNNGESQRVRSCDEGSLQMVRISIVSTVAFSIALPALAYFGNLPGMATALPIKASHYRLPHVPVGARISDNGIIVDAEIKRSDFTGNRFPRKLFVILRLDVEAADNWQFAYPQLLDEKGIDAKEQPELQSGFRTDYVPQSEDDEPDRIGDVMLTLDEGADRYTLRVPLALRQDVKQTPEQRNKIVNRINEGKERVVAVIPLRCGREDFER